MKSEVRLVRKITMIIALAAILAIAVIVGASAERASAAKETEYVFETVPAENIELSVDGDFTCVQPRQSFILYYDVDPWYTTTTAVYVDVKPKGAAIVGGMSRLEFVDGKAHGETIIRVSDDAEVGSTFAITARIDDAVSEPLEMSVVKVPVEAIDLFSPGGDDKLHIGKSRVFECQFYPSYASVQDIRYELSGNGLKYIEDFDEEKGIITAKNDITVLDVNSKVTVTAYSVDNPTAFDSVTLFLFMPTTFIEISAETPLGRVDANGNALAVAGAYMGDYVCLSTKINGVEATGINYVIVKGQEYIEDGFIRADGVFDLRPGYSWSTKMRVPHPEIKIRAAYSDGFDEITIALYVPVEQLLFSSPVVSKVENFRSYNMQVQAFPKYATLLADYAEPIYYSLGGIDSAIATVDKDGTLTLPRSLTSKGSVINFSANLTDAWSEVDVDPLTYDLTVVPVYAEAFESVGITKDGAALDGGEVKALPSDILQVEFVYTIDNVTDMDVTLSADSDLITTVGSTINVLALAAMTADNPFIEITVSYDHGGNAFEQKCYLAVYVPALSAEIDKATFRRDETLDLNEFVVINGHGYASNKTIEWGIPTVTAGGSGYTVACDDGFLDISTQANAGTAVRIPYRTFDSDTWQYKDIVVATLDGAFALEYGQTGSVDGRKYDVDCSAPQLEEGQSVDLRLRYKGMGGSVVYGLTYSVEVSSDKATLSYKSGDKSGDVFALGANSGQSGRNNYITYKITVFDGTATYYVYTDGASIPSAMDNGLRCEKIAIFKRVSGSIGVRESAISENYSFSLSGWDQSFTFNQEDLTWTLTGGSMSGSKIVSAPESGFILTITANQRYNGQEIVYSSQVTFNSVTYKYENSDGAIATVATIYKKSGWSLELAGKVCSRTNYLHNGWSNENNGAKDYAFGATYWDNKDKVLYAYWVKTATTVGIEQEITVDENQGYSSFTDPFWIDLSISELKELGYTTISATFSYDLMKVKQDGECAKIWVEIDDREAFVRDKFEVSSDRTTYTGYFSLNISELSENSKIRIGLFAYGDWKIGKYTFTFYKASIKLTAWK